MLRTSYPAVVRIACIGSVASLLLAIACAGDTDGDAPRDAAAPVAWQLADAPRVTIGVVEGDERYQLIRVSSAWKDDRGRIIASDAGRPALVFFDSAGTFLQQVGGRGAGPGEFQTMWAGWRYRGDSIAVFDLTQRRISVFDAEGDFGRALINPVVYARKPGTIPSQGCCQVRGSFSDGSFVVHPPDDIPTHAGPPRYSMLTLMRVSADGTVQDSIGTFESRYFEADPASPNGVRGGAGSYGFSYAVLGDQLIGGNGQSQYLVRARPGRAGLDSVPLEGEPVPLADDVRREYEAALRADYELRGRSYYEGSLESNLPAVYAPTVPRFASIQGDADGRLWLLRWTPSVERQGSAREYDILSTDARHIATIRLPARSRLMWSAGREVLLVEFDSLDVQYLRLYDIVEEDAAPSARE
jgi:hypothetical protein